MRHLWLGLLFTAFALVLGVSGCGQKPVPQAEPATQSPAASSPVALVQSTATPATAATEEPTTPNTPELAVSMPTGDMPAIPDASPQEKYDAAILEALNLAADKQYADALVKLGAARSLQDTEQVQREIERIKGLLDQQAAAVKTAQDIQTVLEAGKPEEAAQLATASLQQFGPTDEADRLARLKREADALTAAQVDDNTIRQTKFRREAEAALAEKNLRAASIALEQALQCGEDPSLRQNYETVVATLARYDQQRKRAAELRRDPANLEEALAALRDAAAAWDTLQVRQEIEEYTLCLQKRRDRLSVADFEVRGDVGIPAPGRTVAEELLPAFKARFDLVERAQLARIADELRLESGSLAESPQGQQEIGRLARLSYLVLGSVSRLDGLTVNARLVDVRSGLIVQTAKIVAATPQEMLARLPLLARLLGMNDEQKFAYEQELARRAAPVVSPIEIRPLPPPPAPPSTAVPPPPPILVFSARPPEFGGLCAEDFDRLPLVSNGRPAFAAEVRLEREAPIKDRLLQVAVSLGDNLFRRGRYREAHAQFELALHLSPGHLDLQVRLDRCRAQLPAPPPTTVIPAVVVTQPAPPPAVVVVPSRPRLAVLNFIVNADAAHAPPGLGDWAADQLASYYAPTYEIVDRGEVFWYMGRLGITVRDVAVDVSARRWLARALNVRYFAFGIVQQTASLNVSTHLVDAASGLQQGLGSIHVQDHQELKLRLGELAHQSQSNPADRAKLLREAQESERAVAAAQQLLKAGKFAEAIAACDQGLKTQSKNVALQAVKQQAQARLQAQQLEQARRQEAAQREALAAAARRQQEELAKQAEAARRRAAQLAQAQTEAARQAQEQRRKQAFLDLVAKGRSAFQKREYAQALAILESAAALQPGPEIQREIAQTRAAAEQANKDRAAAELARRQAEQQRQREAELARARQQVEEVRRRKEIEEQARRKEQETRDAALAAKLTTEARQHLAQGKYDLAQATLLDARRLHRSDEIDRLLAEAQAKMPKKVAANPAPPARVEGEPRPPASKSPPQTVVSPPPAAAVPKKADRPTPSVGNNAVTPPKKVDPPTPPAARPPTATPPPANPKPTPAVLASFNRQLQAGAALEKQLKWDDAIRVYQEALRLVPNDPRAGTALHLALGQKAMQAKKFADAAREFELALKLTPNQPDATRLLKQARQGIR